MIKTPEDLKNQIVQQNKERADNREIAEFLGQFDPTLNKKRKLTEMSYF